ncbi:MAG: hypothetical protein D6766_07255 [Verrucomicrobia bacterium]|nr:MAG: hypothetical protein D6766_07255 [Verrucomicrobiota bacterium]
MTAETKESVVLTAMILVFVALYGVFVEDLTGRVRTPPPPEPTPAWATNTGTVRISAAEVIATDGDTSMMECYVCHTEGERQPLKLDSEGRVILVVEHSDLIFGKKRCLTCHDESEEASLELEYDDDGRVILPKGHEDLVLRHGEYGRNNNCYNCHNPDKLDELVTRQGKKYPLSESTMLCVSCHGPTYRDWLRGLHGRTSGYWNREMGEARREPCAACHDPHHPEFPHLRPAPAPRRLHGGQPQAFAGAHRREAGGDGDGGSDENHSAQTAEEPEEG